MKTKLMAVLLAAGLGVTGIAMTAQAAEAGIRAVNGCAHTDMIFKRKVVVKAINWNGNQHYVEYKITYFCPECTSDIVEGEATYEPHDFEQIYYDDGRVLSYCTVCDESFYW